MRRLTFQGANDKPTWTPDGKRIVFSSDREGDIGLFWQRADGSGSAERLARAEVGATLQSQPSFVVGRPIPLPIEGIVRTGSRTYDITPDGKHFVVMFPKSEANPDKAPRDQINVTLNWFEELKAKVPAGK